MSNDLPTWAVAHENDPEPSPALPLAQLTPLVLANDPAVKELHISWSLGIQDENDLYALCLAIVRHARLFRNSSVIVAVALRASQDHLFERTTAAIGQLPNLVQIELYQCYPNFLTPKISGVLTALLQYPGRLQTLRVGAPVRAAVDVFAWSALALARNLQCLEIWSMDCVVDRDVPLLMPLLLTAARNLPRLETLHLRNKWYAEHPLVDQEALFLLIHECRELTSLALCNFGLNLSMALPIIADLPALRQLDVSDNWRGSDVGLPQYCRHLEDDYHMHKFIATQDSREKKQYMTQINTICALNLAGRGAAVRSDARTYLELIIQHGNHDVNASFVMLRSRPQIVNCHTKQQMELANADGPCRSPSAENGRRRADTDWVEQTPAGKRRKQSN